MPINFDTDPYIKGNYVVWRNNADELWVYDIVGTSKTKVTTLTDTGLNTQFFVTDDNTVVWHDEIDGDSEVFMYDIGTGAITNISNDVVWHDSWPRVNGNTITWYKGDAGTVQDVYLHLLDCNYPPTPTPTPTPTNYTYAYIHTI